MFTAADEAHIAAQTGRTLRGVIAVAARCPAGHPCVVTCYPLKRVGRRVTPFPTLYWLTCPQLHRRLADLERTGAIAVIEAELKRDPAMRARLLRDHDDYIHRRWAMLTEADRLLISARGLINTFLDRGIGGMTNRAAVKCLHLHLAHHLAGGNAIGEWLVQRYGVRPCGEEVS